MMRGCRLGVLALACASCASAERTTLGETDASTDAVPGDAASDAPPIDGPRVVTLQQSVDTVIAAANSLTCFHNNGSNESAENGWYRVFALTEHGVMGQPFRVQQVTFAVQRSVGSPPAQVLVGTYSAALGTRFLDLSKVTPKASMTVTIPPTDTGAMMMVPIDAMIEADAQIIVEIRSPDLGGTGGKRTLIGSTMGGEMAGRTAYFRAPLCQRPMPETVATVGFPTARYIITVTGQY